MERDEVLANSETLEVLSSALHLALECDLSELAWPGNSRQTLEGTFASLDRLMNVATSTKAKREKLVAKLYSESDTV